MQGDRILAGVTVGEDGVVRLHDAPIGQVVLVPDELGLPMALLVDAEGLALDLEVDARGARFVPVGEPRPGEAARPAPADGA